MFYEFYVSPRAIAYETNDTFPVPPSMKTGKYCPFYATQNCAEVKYTDIPFCISFEIELPFFKTCNNRCHSCNAIT